MKYKYVPRSRIKWKTASVRLTFEQYKKLMKICKKKGITLSEYIKSKMELK